MINRVIRQVIKISKKKKNKVKYEKNIKMLRNELAPDLSYYFFHLVVIFLIFM